jgi:hypothetical protein
MDSVGSGITVFGVRFGIRARVSCEAYCAARNATSRVTAVADLHPTEIRPQFESDDVLAPI